MRIGIVGTGIAGLTAGWYLKDAGHHVTVFERQNSLGMGAHCVEFQLDDSSPDAARLYSDVPPRMFNSAQWPNLWRLYRELGVEVEPINPTKSFAQQGQAAVLKLGADYQPKLSAQLVLNSDSRTILKDIGRMMKSAPEFLQEQDGLDDQSGDCDAMTLREYLDAHEYSEAFINQFLFPALSSTVCTCSYQSLDRYPAATLLAAMLRLIEPEGLFRTSHGTRDVVSRLSQAFDEVHLDTAITGVVQTEAGCEISAGQGDVFQFDHVVVATQANSAIGLTAEITDHEKDALSHFKYETVQTVLHTDAALMPARTKDWTTFNVISNPENSAAMCSILLNEFYRQWDCDQPVFQTIMPLIAPRRETVITQASMQRPVVDSASKRGYELLGELHAQPDRRIWYCGSYASPGVPLLESGVNSAMEVAQRLLAPTPI